MSAIATETQGRIHNVGIAEARVVCEPDLLRTVLGSCVGVALYDPVRKIGGLVHVMLPTSQGFPGEPAKFADTGVELLINMMLKAGADKARLIAKIAGGATMFGSEREDGIGYRNAEAVRAKLSEHSICIVAEDLGGTKGRKMLLDTSTGTVTVERIGEKPRAI